jgi:hypothetical protein
MINKLVFLLGCVLLAMAGLLHHSTIPVVDAIIFSILYAASLLLLVVFSYVQGSGWQRRMVWYVLAWLILVLGVGLSSSSRSATSACVAVLLGFILLPRPEAAAGTERLELNGTDWLIRALMYTIYTCITSGVLTLALRHTI